RVPHRKTYTIDRADLLEYVEPDELNLPSLTLLPEKVILIARPDAEHLSAMTRGRALVKFWRLLMHARVHQVLDEQINAGEITIATARDRFEQLGPAALDEARLVLHQDDMLVPPVDALRVYVEFVATFAELRYFAPGLLRDYFPSI